MEKVYVKALHNFAATHETQLSFEKDDLFTVIERKTKDWWVAKHNGKTGFIPSNFVEILKIEATAKKREAGVGLSNRMKDEAKAKFEFYDKDNSGTIDRDELRALCVDMNPKLKKGMIERIVNLHMSQADKDKSGDIDFDEFLGVYKKLITNALPIAIGPPGLGKR